MPPTSMFPRDIHSPVPLLPSQTSQPHLDRVYRDNFKFVAAVFILLGACSVITGDVFRILTVEKFGTPSSSEIKDMLFAA